MTSPTDKLREVMREYLKNNVASEYNANEWWGWDTNVGDLLSDELLAPFHSLLLSERTRLEGLLPREKAMEMGFDLDAMSHGGQPTTRTSKLSQRDIGFNACLREVRELFGEKETPQ